MDIPEKLATQSTQDEDKKDKKDKNKSKNKKQKKQNKAQHNTILFGNQYTQANTNYADTTLAILSTTGGKDEPSIVLDISTNINDK